MIYKTTEKDLEIGGFSKEEKRFLREMIDDFEKNQSLFDFYDKWFKKIINFYKEKFDEIEKKEIFEIFRDLNFRLYVRQIEFSILDHLAMCSTGHDNIAGFKEWLNS